jgi:hypothetical protein
MQKSKGKEKEFRKKNYKKKKIFFLNFFYLNFSKVIDRASQLLVDINIRNKKLELKPKMWEDFINDCQA